MTMAVTEARGPRPAGRAVRVDRQHLGVGRGLCRARRHHLRGADPAGQDRDGQARAGGHARRQDHPDRRQLRRLPGTGPQADRRLPDHRAWSTRSTRSASRARRRRRSRSSTRWASRPMCTRCRSATPATSPPTGRATREYHRDGLSDRAAADARHPGRRRGAAGARRAGAATPRPSPPRSGSARPRRGRRPSRRSRSPTAASSPPPTRRSWPPITWWRAPKGVFVEPASAASIAGLLKSIEDGWVEPGLDGGVHRDRQRAQGPRHRAQGHADGHAGAGRSGGRGREARVWSSGADASVTQTLPAGLTATCRRRGVQCQPRARVRQPGPGAESLRRNRRGDNRIRPRRRSRGGGRRAGSAGPDASCGARDRARAAGGRRRGAGA